MLRLWPILQISFVALAAAAAGCTRHEPTTPPPKPKPAPARTDVKAVYPDAPETIPAPVRTLCDALHGLPNRRKAACCEGTPGVVVTGECERNLAGAVSTGGLVLDVEAVKTCTTALSRSFEGCDWVGPHMPEVPAACVDALVGQRDADAVCRSSLECKGASICAGVTPTEPGRCRPPAPAGKVCNTGVDPLAPYLRIDLDAHKPPCADGFCDKNVCRAAIGAGGDCLSSVQCGEGLRCAGGRCIDGAKGAEGEPCTGGDCADGLRCVGQTCSEPRPAGAPCIQHAQCEAGCVQNLCKMVCSPAELLRALPAANQPPKPVLKPGIRLKAPDKKTLPPR